MAIKNKKYHFIAREYGFGLGTCETIVSDSIGYFLHNGALVFDAPAIEFYVTDKELKLRSQAGYDLCSGKDKSKKLIKKAEAISRPAKLYFDSLKQKDLKDLTNQDLLEQYDEYGQWVATIVAIYSQTEPHCFSLVEQIILKALQDKLNDEKKVRQAFSSLMIPTLKQELLTLRDQGFIELALERKENPHIEKKIKSFQRKYGFIYVVTEETNGDLEDVKNRLNEAIKKDAKDLKKELAIIEENHLQIASDSKSLMKSLRLDNDVMVLIRSASNLGLMRLNLAQYLRYGVIFSGKFLREFGRRTLLSADQVEALLFEELEEWLLQDKKVSLDVINKRKKRFVLVFDNGKMELLVGKNADEFIKKVKPPINLENISEISGSVANSGKIKGFVRVVSSFEGTLQKQIKEMRKGEILVTEMTRPQVLLAVKKASAIVTDEGGINCHAAIMSRELNIPCIIGTKIATQVLKDGDEVEVDANEGIVRILKKV